MICVGELDRPAGAVEAGFILNSAERARATQARHGLAPLALDTTTHHGSALWFVLSCTVRQMHKCYG